MFQSIRIFYYNRVKHLGRMSVPQPANEKRQFTEETVLLNSSINISSGLHYLKWMYSDDTA